MGLVGSLVRTEPRVAIDAIKRLVRIVDVIRSELRQFSVDPFDKVEHGRFDLLFENFFARLEPVAIVVARKIAEKSERFGRKHDDAPLKWERCCFACWR